MDYGPGLPTELRPRSLGGIAGLVPLDTNLIADRESLPRHGYCPTPCSMKATLADARVGYHIGGNGDRPPPQHQTEQHPSDDRDRAAAVPPRSTISWRERFDARRPFATISSTHHAGIRTAAIAAPVRPGNCWCG